MKKRFLNTGILFMALVALLAAIGIGYAMWDKTLNITGTVKTGSVNAEFTSVCTDDDGVVDCPHGQDMDDTGVDPRASGPDSKPRDADGKDIGSCVAGLAEGDPQPGNQSATVTITDGYPSYYCTAWFGIANNGTIPVKVQAIEQHMNVGHYYSCDDGSTWTFVAASTWYDYCGTSVIKRIDLDANHWDDMVPDWDLDVHVTKLLIGDQIEPTEHSAIDLDIHVAQGAAQNAGRGLEGDPPAYQVDHQIELVQWNEYEEPSP